MEETMIHLSCRTPDCDWASEQACRECADDTAGRHRQLGHVVEMYNDDVPDRGWVRVVPNVPEWMRPSRKVSR